MDSRKSGVDGAGTRIVLTDEEGKTIKYLKLTAAEGETASVYRTLSASKDGSKILYSHGPSAIDVYMYDIKTEKTVLIADKNAFQPRWSKKYNSIYYLTMELNKGVYNVYLHRYDVK